MSRSRTTPCIPCREKKQHLDPVTLKPRDGQETTMPQQRYPWGDDPPGVCLFDRARRQYYRRNGDGTVTWHSVPKGYQFNENGDPVPVVTVDVVRRTFEPVQE